MHTYSWPAATTTTPPYTHPVSACPVKQSSDPCLFSYGRRDVRGVRAKDTKHETLKTVEVCRAKQKAHEARGIS